MSIFCIVFSSEIKFFCETLEIMKLILINEWLYYIFAIHSSQQMKHQKSNIQIINEEAFSYCSKLGHFTIPNGIISIEPKAFYSCKSLSEVEFPLNCQLETIKGLAFGNCPLLKEFKINKNDQKFQFDNGVLTDKNGSSIYVYLPTSNNDYFVVPSRVTTIKPFAFQYCTNLEAIYIPDGTLTHINIHAFEGCERLTTIYFPDSLKEVGSMAFHNCPKLRCGRVRVANDYIKAMVINASIPQDVFNTYCPSYEITCKYNVIFSSKASIMLGFYLFAFK